MRNQNKYDELERLLNSAEEQTLHEVEQKSGMRIPAKSVMYERHTPRATVCTIFLSPWRTPFWTCHITGVAIRNKKDKENPITGQEQSFRRALEDYVERKKIRI